MADTSNSQSPCDDPCACASDQPRAVSINIVVVALHNELLDIHQKKLCKPRYVLQWVLAKGGLNVYIVVFPTAKKT